MNELTSDRNPRRAGAAPDAMMDLMMRELIVGMTRCVSMNRTSTRVRSRGSTSHADGAAGGAGGVTEGAGSGAGGSLTSVTEPESTARAPAPLLCGGRLPDQDDRGVGRAVRAGCLAVD